MESKLIINNYIKENKGYLLVKDLEKEISYNKIRYYIKNNKDLIKVKKGLYRTKDAWVDVFYEVSILNPNIIFSHRSALDLHNFSQRESMKIEVSIYQGYNNKILNNFLNIYYIKKENFELGLTEIETMYGHKIKVYDLERTICDIVKIQKDVDVEIYNKAWNLYLQSEEKNINKLFYYASKLNVLNKIKQYMEVSYV